MESAAERGTEAVVPRNRGRESRGGNKIGKTRELEQSTDIRELGTGSNRRGPKLGFWESRRGVLKTERMGNWDLKSCPTTSMEAQKLLLRREENRRGL